MNQTEIQNIIEAALLAAGKPVHLDRLITLFEKAEQPSRDDIRAAIEALQENCAERGVELVQVASGYRYQVKKELADWIGRMADERPPRYSKALLETLSLVAYRQPITRAEIEDVRGVSVSSSIIRTLIEREWVKAVGHRDVPGRPALYATTRKFLDYFDLKSLSDLPPLSELRDIETIEQDLFADLDLPASVRATLDGQAGTDIAIESALEDPDSEVDEQDPENSVEVTAVDDDADQTSAEVEADELSKPLEETEIS